MTNTCSVPECGRDVSARDHCAAHSWRLKKWGDVRADIPVRPRRPKDALPEGIYWCFICKTEKPGKEMHAPQSLVRWNRKTGTCRSCRATQRAERGTNAWEWLRRNYRLSPEDYNLLVRDQEGVCAICEKPPQKGKLVVDHDHNCCPEASTCGKCIRGLLCTGCNTRLEWWINRGKKAEEYLAKGVIDMDERRSLMWLP